MLFPIGLGSMAQGVWVQAQKSFGPKINPRPINLIQAQDGMGLDQKLAHQPKAHQFGGMGLTQELAQTKGPCPSTRPIDLWIGLGLRVGPITKPKSILQYKVFWLVRLLYTYVCVLLTLGAKELVGCVEIGKCRDLIHVM